MNIHDYSKVTDRIEINEKCRDEVLNMKRNKKKITHKMNKKAVISIIAAAVVACGGTAAFAADYFGVFDRLDNKANGTIVNDSGKEFDVDKYDNNNYEIIGQHAEQIPTENAALLEKTEGNINITPESVYCDGRSLVIAITGSFADGNPTNAGYVCFDAELTINGKTYRSVDWGNRVDFYDFTGSMVRDENETNSFTGSITITFDDKNLITEADTAELKISNILYGEYYYSSMESFGEELEMTVDIAPQTELLKKCNLTMDENGFKAKVYEVSPAMIMIGANEPETYNGMDVGLSYSPVTLYYDENGEQIDFLEIKTLPNYYDELHTVCLASTESSTITVKWFNKQVQDENGNMELLHEYTFDISEYNQ